MNTGTRDPLKARRFLRSYLGRAVIGLALIVLIESIQILMIVVPYLREKQIAARIEALGARVDIQNCAPDWIPWSIRFRTPIFDRIFGCLDKSVTKR